MTNRAQEQRQQWLRNSVFLLALTTASQSYGTETQAEVPAEPATPALEQPADAPSDATPENEAGDAVNEENPETSESEETAETEQPAEPDAPAEEPAPAASETDADPSATEAISDGNRYYLFAGIAVLLIILAVLIRLVGRNRKQSRAPLPQVEEASPAPFGYFHISGAGQQRIYNLSADVINVGRSANNDLVLSNDTVSSSHLVVKRERNGCVLVTDLNSSNGTRINGEDVSQAKLVPGDELELGEVMIRFETRAPASAADMTRQAG